MRPHYALRFSFLLLLLATVAGARDLHYVQAGEVDLVRVLAPPPAQGSAAEARDLAAVLEAQQARSPEDVARARADVELNPFRFADVLGPTFTPERLPKTAALLARVTADAKALYEVPKNYYARPRPFDVSAEVQPVVDKPKSASYPSGHSTCSYLWTIVLADLVPEKRAELFARGREYGRNRVVGGVHFPTDDEAGRVSASVIAAAMFRSPAFRAARHAARAELRTVLGLP